MIAQGYLVPATRPPTENTYFIPHHAVQTKFRVVYDGSCKTNRSVSINEMQLAGPKLQRNLAATLLKFRIFKQAITADVKKMYLQVKVHPDQWDFQRIFWREDPEGEVGEYWLTRLTFGMASAPYCAVRAMLQCAEDGQKEFPEAAQVVRSDFIWMTC